jgi:CheY-specific phosphatase CheX
MNDAMPADAAPLPMEAAAALAPFVDAALAALRDWANAEAFAAARWLGLPPLDSRRCTATMALRRAAPGTLFVSVPADFAAVLATRVFAEIEDPGSANLAADCVGELANLIAGHAKALLRGTPAHFALGTPVLQAPPGIPFATALLKCELGELMLGVA